ncbi:MAG: hypothetical protein LBQ88_12675 [Treponema sp.]|nr:hypothetical protein [Treponema sp.]
MYELFDQAVQSGRHFLIRIVQNQMTVENEQILDNHTRNTLQRPYKGAYSPGFKM